jgi:hypothetical protein
MWAVVMRCTTQRTNSQKYLPCSRESRWVIMVNLNYIKYIFFLLRYRYPTNCDLLLLSLIFNLLGCNVFFFSQRSTVIVFFSFFEASILKKSRCLCFYTFLPTHYFVSGSDPSESFGSEPCWGTRGANRPD